MNRRFINQGYTERFLHLYATASFRTREKMSFASCLLIFYSNQGHSQKKIMTETMCMVKFSSQVLKLFMTTINEEKEKTDWGKCLGFPVTSNGPAKCNQVNQKVHQQKTVFLNSFMSCKYKGCYVLTYTREAVPSIRLFYV